MRERGAYWTLLSGCKREMSNSKIRGKEGKDRRETGIIFSSAFS